MLRPFLGVECGKNQCQHTVGGEQGGPMKVRLLDLNEFGLSYRPKSYFHGLLVIVCVWSHWLRRCDCWLFSLPLCIPAEMPFDGTVHCCESCNRV